MTSDEARRFVVDNVVVRRQHLMLMKGLLLEHYNDDPTVMLDAAIKRIGASNPSDVVLHPTVDPVPVLRQFAEWISWQIAGYEALWGLVHSNVLLTVTAGMTTLHPSIQWTTVVPGSGGERGGWDFPEFKISIPNWLTRSRASTVPQVLCDPDLFLQELNIPDLHSEVADALREAVFCFGAELHTAAIVMLGKASEGTWIEMGLALASKLSDEEADKRQKLRQEWSGPDVGFAKKMRDIMKFYESRQGMFKHVGTAANVRLDDLRMAMIWSDSLRDARNLVHHNVATNINPTFEMVSTLFLAALTNLKALHRFDGGGEMRRVPDFWSEFLHIHLDGPNSVFAEFNIAPPMRFDSISAR
jgi:hypothetical protein